MAKTGDYLIPFSKVNGNQYVYADDYWPKDVEWKPNHEFTACLTYGGYERGQSAAHFIFKDEQGRTRYMFLAELDAIMNSGGFDGNSTTGLWTFVKRGKNYGVRLIEQHEG